MSSWLENFKAHIDATGAFWTKGAMDRYSIVSRDEKNTLLRKKQLLKDRRAEIVHTEVEAKIIRKQTFEDKRIVTYLCYLKNLIKQNNFFYIEETIQERRSIFQGDVLISDEEIINIPKEDPVNETEEVSREKPSLRYQYQRLAVVKYADQWWNRYNTQYKKFENDCTNYVSQCLHAGGIPMHGEFNRNKGWWFKNNNWSYSWAVANALRWYLSGNKNGIRVQEVDKPERLVPGDVICYDFEGDGNWNHNTVVTDKDARGMPLVNAHTFNARHRYWSYEDSPAWTSNIQYRFFQILDN